MLVSELGAEAPPALRPALWHAREWQFLQRQRQRLPHALLMSGFEGVGKQQFAEAFSAALLCKQPQEHGLACGICSACRWFVQNSHPDYRLVRARASEDPQPASLRERMSIRIEQVRGLESFFQLTSHGGLRIAVIVAAEQLNRASANALLKTLEEPPEGTFLVLLTTQIDQLLPTIRSRCVCYPLTTPDEKTIRQTWAEAGKSAPSDDLLALAAGNPLLAERYQAAGWEAQWRTCREWLAQPKTDPILLASEWAAWPVSELHDWLQKWIYDVICVNLGLPGRYYPRYKAYLPKLGRSSARFAWLDFQRRLWQAGRLLHHPLNPKLRILPWLFKYRQLFRESLTTDF